MADNEGWTNVCRGKGSRAPRDVPNLDPRIQHDSTVTVPDLHSVYDKAMLTWKSSDCRTEVRRQLDQAYPDEECAIDNAICIASGSFTINVVSLQKRRLLQLAAFMDTVAHIQSRTNQTIAIHAEDVAYSSVDVTFLEALNITCHVQTLDDYTNKAVVLSPINASSMVWELFIDNWALPTLMQIMRADVRLLVGTDMLDKTLLLMSRESPQVGKKYPRGTPLPKSLEAVESAELRELRERFLKETSFQHFPRFEPDEQIFNGLEIYKRVPTDNDDENEAGSKP